MAALEVSLWQSFAGRPDSAPFDLSVSFEAGDGITVFFGPSGSGKTLTLESIAGFSRPRRGSIRLLGRVLFDSETGIWVPARERHCGYVFQKDTLFPHMSLRQNLEFAAANSPADGAQARISSILEDFHLTAVAGRRPRELSGGERQRGAIARALIARPRLLLLDEPARGLDIGLRQQLYSVLRKVRADYGLPMVLVTHDLEEAFELGDAMLVYHQGRIAQRGLPREIYEQPATPTVARLLGLTNVFEGTIVEADRGKGVARLSAGGFEVSTPFNEGFRSGEHVRFCIRPHRVVATPRNGVLKDGEVAMQLVRAVPQGGQVKLEFAGSISAHVPQPSFEQQPAGREWTVKFAPDAVWVFPETEDASAGSEGPTERAPA